MGKKNLIGVIGAIFIVMGFIWTVALAVRESPPIIGLILTGLIAITGVLMIAWALGD